MATNERKPNWWPSGADEQLVRECNCEHCRELIERLEDEYHAVEDGQPSLSAFAGGASD